MLQFDYIIFDQFMYIMILYIDVFDSSMKL